MSENDKNKENVGNDTIHSVMPCLSDLRELYLNSVDDTKISDLKPMFQNYKSIREKETLHFIEFASYRMDENLLSLKLTKNEAQKLLNALIRTMAKGDDLDFSMKIERLLSVFLS